jgi:restriction system protein
MHKVRTPIFPTYSDVRHLLRILPGVPRAELMKMISDIMDQTGTPQNPVDWLNRTGFSGSPALCVD